jgi:hypothetical protein
MPKIKYITRRFGRAALTRIAQVNAIITEYQQQGYILTLRQLYYQLVSRDLIPNTIKSYKNLGSVVNDARLAGLIDWNAIEDRTRNLCSVAHWDGPQDIVETCAQQFSIDLWEDQDNYVEVWIEKEALLGVIERICRKLDVPYFACRGYVSQSEMWGAAQRILQREECGKRATIIHLGDHDPSGIDMTRDIEERLRLFGTDASIQRIALTMDQVEEYGPPPNPAKTTDARYQGYVNIYGDESWELDALEPKIITSLITEAINPLRDNERWNRAYQRQLDGRSQLDQAALRWDEVKEALGM